MSVLELKQQVSKLSKRQRQELHACLVRMSHETPEWKRTTARRIDAMKRKRRVSHAELAERVRRG